MKTRLFLLFALAVSTAFADFPVPANPDSVNRADLVSMLQTNAANAQKWAEYCRHYGNEDMAKRLDGISIANDYLAVMLADPAGTWVYEFDAPPEIDDSTLPPSDSVTPPDSGTPDDGVLPGGDSTGDNSDIFPPDDSGDSTVDPSAGDVSADSPDVSAPPRSTIVILPPDDYGTDNPGDSSDEENDGTGGPSDTSGDEGGNG